MSLIKGIDHVQLAMPHGGEPQAREFWTGAMGLAEVPKPAQLAHNGGCWFESANVSIHYGVEKGFIPARRAHPALLVANLGALVAKLEAVGIFFQPGKKLEGYRRGDITDPFGNRIELMEKL